MTNAMTREEWLELEIDFAVGDADRLAHAADPVQRAHGERRRREATMYQAELARLRQGARMEIRLTGARVDHHNAPIEAVAEMISRVSELADEFGAEIFVAPARPGSHVIELTGPSARSLFEDDPVYNEDDAFLAAARALVDLAPAQWGGESRWQRQIETKAADLSDAGVRAAKGFLHAIAANNIRAELDLSSRHEAAHASISAAEALFIQRVLNDVDRTTRTINGYGTLHGFARGALRFEVTLDDDEEIKGRVPKAKRDLANGIAIGTRVFVEVEEITTHLRSGGERRHFRLVEISPAAG